MKSIFIIIALCFCTIVHAQNNNSKIDSIQKQVDTLVQRTDEKNYVRIPRNDFDKIIDNKVNSEIHSEMHEWQWIISAILTILGALGLFYFRSQLKNEVNTSVSALKADVNKSVDSQLQESLSVFWDDLASSIVERAAARKYAGADLKTSLEKLLNVKTISLQEDMKVQVVDALVCYYYYSNEKDKTQQMIKLVKTYENELYLTTQTFANLAIAFTTSYSMYGTKDDRVNAIEYCEKSIQRLPDYGTSYALKLEVYIIYYIKGTPDEKKDALNLLDLTFHSIRNNSSEELPCEIVERLTLDASEDINNRDNNIITLEKMFVLQLNEIKLRAITYLMNHYNRVITENNRYLDILKTILNYGLKNSPDINGTWVAIHNNPVGAGEQVDEREMTIVFADMTYRLTVDNEVEDGIVYFIAPEEQKSLCMNLYSIQDNVLNKITEVIYNRDKDTLQICFGSKPSERPTTLSTGVDNKYRLVTYKKVV